MQEFREQLSKRMREAAKSKGLTIAEVANQLGMKHSAVSHYFNGINEPKARILLRFSEIVGVPIQDLLNPPSEVRHAEQFDLTSGEFVRLPIRDVRLSAGPGAEPGSEETIGHLAFRAEWLRSLHIEPGEASLVRVDGDSMAPTLESGDMVLIDHRRRTLIGKSAIFACRADTDLMIKRVEMLPKTRNILLHSDNPDHPTQEVPADKAPDFELIGKVVWSARTWQGSGY